jgi:hypothetical protein
VSVYGDEYDYDHAECDQVSSFHLIDVVVITAKRLRPEAQGCFNPGEIGYDISTLKGLRRLTNRNGKFGCDPRRNRVAV